MTLELKNRIIYGALSAALGLGAVYIGGLVFFSAVIIISFLISREFDNLRKDGKISFLFIGLPIIFSYHPEIALTLTLIAIISVTVFDMFLKTNNPWLIISIAYTAIPAISIIWLRETLEGINIVLWLLLVIISTDIGAYFVGKKFGKRLLAPSISPKKTWEGLFGGLLLAAITSAIYTGNLNFILLAIIFGIIEQLSDLLESSIKRYFDVKDTGKILPGHGGIMDRLDGLVLTAPLAAIFVYYGIITW